MTTTNKKTIYVALGALVLGLLLGWFFFRNSTGNNHSQHNHEQTKSAIWTCSMHPQIRQPDPGQCPICGMDLIPLNTKSEDENPMEIKMSPTAMQLANVQTSIIRKDKPVKELRINGKVKADERNVFSQSSHIPGRIEKLLVSFTGERVSKGQILAYVYSPELVTAQEELFEANKIRERQPQLYQAARGKLLNWKLTETQINHILQTGQIQEQFPILADVSGIILNKRINLGDYIKVGQPIFEVADLSRVWVLFDVYESDMLWVNKGDEVRFTVQSLPGETFKGNITFIDPVIDSKTRVAKARVEMPNRGGKLKPEMFVSGVVNNPLEEMKEQLIVPKSSVMWTGERSVIYVKHSSASGIGFMMREVVLGPSLGDSYVVYDGLDDGEEIATNGTFSIDAAAQLAGKPSMINPNGGMTMVGHNHGGGKTEVGPKPPTGQSVNISKGAKRSLYKVFEEYIDLKDALVKDNYKAGIQKTNDMLRQIEKINMTLFKGEAHDLWMNHSVNIKTSLKHMTRTKNIGEARQQFKVLSDHTILLALSFGPFETPLFVQTCPMANDNKGADWISKDREIENPYFGESMIGCGDVINEITE
ncbi:MAG: efflux RND transporter periplasmic adaptor subunit [Bacteroidia bacterium]|nr:efflux RND transporter periplasmic adaptor subunit [Bacteroidia bacterium]